MSWQRLGAVAPSQLGEARLQVHHAVQIVSAAGATLVEPRPDDSHPNLGWSSSHRAFVGHALDPVGHRAALRPEDLALLVLDGSGAVAASTSLVGQGFEQGRRWLGEALGARGVDVPDKGLRRLPYGLPAHPVVSGAAFGEEPAPARAELARWYDDLAALFEEVREGSEGASEVRCWPHHFDLATLIAIDRGPDGAATHTVGVGLSPGDESYAEPYLYVSPWPYPEADRLPDLARGRWHVEGFTAAVLTGSALVAADDQAAHARGFVEEAVAASRAALA